MYSIGRNLVFSLFEALFLFVGVNMAGVATIGLLLLLPLCTLQSAGQINPHQAAAAPQLRDLFAQEQAPHMNTMPTSKSKV